MHLEQARQEIIAGFRRLTISLGRVDPLGNLRLGEVDKEGHARTREELFEFGNQRMPLRIDADIGTVEQVNMQGSKQATLVGAFVKKSEFFR